MLSAGGVIQQGPMNTPMLLALRRLMGSGLTLAVTACAPMATAPSGSGAASISAMTPATISAAREAAPVQTPCPKTVPTDVHCLAGQDSRGAHYLIAMPTTWSGVLVLHAHGGPTLGAPKAERAVEDLQRWVIWVRAGHAFAASTFADGGVQVRAAAADTERLRLIFNRHVAVPRRTVLHGQSWGASVAAKGAEIYGAPDQNGKRAYDAVLLTSGVLGGGTRSYDFRLDLRAVYQVLCNNHPRADEAAYPLWMGLPTGVAFDAADLRLRTRECLGLGMPAAQRSPEQARKLKALVDVIRVPEASVQGHLNWATQHFADIAHLRSGGKPVFGNIGAVYGGTGSAEGDAALNASVPRYRADAQAVKAFAQDTDFEGRMPVPVLSAHAVNDPVAFVELQDQFRRTLEAGGSADKLVQVYTSDNEHSYLSDPLYPALIDALMRWAEGGAKPTPSSIAQACEALQARFGAGCRMLPDYQPKALDTRVAPRERP
jgi:hypothetical protein